MATFTFVILSSRASLDMRLVKAHWKLQLFPMRPKNLMHAKLFTRGKIVSFYWLSSQ